MLQWVLKKLTENRMYISGILGAFLVIGLIIFVLRRV